MKTKTIAIEIKLTQDDIDWLMYRACYCLQKMHESILHDDKVHYWLMFEAYNDMYEASKDKLKKQGVIENENN